MRTELVDKWRGTMSKYEKLEWSLSVWLEKMQLGPFDRHVFLADVIGYIAAVAEENCGSQKRKGRGCC